MFTICTTTDMIFYLSCSATLWGEKIIVTGGAPNLAEKEETMYILQIQDNQILVKRVGLNMDPRFGHTSHVLRNHLFLVGGVGIRETPGTLLLDIVSFGNINILF